MLHRVVAFWRVWRCACRIKPGAVEFHAAGQGTGLAAASDPPMSMTLPKTKLTIWQWEPVFHFIGLPRLPPSRSLRSRQQFLRRDLRLRASATHPVRCPHGLSGRSGMQRPGGAYALGQQLPGDGR